MSWCVLRLIIDGWLPGTQALKLHEAANWTAKWGALTPWLLLLATEETVVCVYHIQRKLLCRGRSRSPKLKKTHSHILCVTHSYSVSLSLSPQPTRSSSESSSSRPGSCTPGSPGRTICVSCGDDTCSTPSMLAATRPQGWFHIHHLSFIYTGRSHGQSLSRSRCFFLTVAANKHLGKIANLEDKNWYFCVFFNFVWPWLIGTCFFACDRKLSLQLWLSDAKQIRVNHILNGNTDQFECAGISDCIWACKKKLSLSVSFMILSFYCVEGTLPPSEHVQIWLYYSFYTCKPWELM